MAKKSVSDKEKELLEIIEKAKKDLIKLQEKQKMEIGGLACKHRLNELDNVSLNEAFNQIAKNYNLV